MPSDHSVSEGAIRDFERLRTLLKRPHVIEYGLLTCDEGDEVHALFDIIIGRLVVLAEMEAQFRNEASNPG